MLRVLIVAMLVSSAAFGQAITGASGVFSTGQTVTISGSGFGSKSPAAPVLWDNFEGGSNGAAIGNAQIGGAYLRSNYVEYTSTDAYSGSLSAVNPADTYSLVNPGLIYRWPVGNKRAFFSAKIKYDFIDDNAGVIANIKMFRLKYGNDGDYVHGYPFLSMDKPQAPSTSMRFFCTNGQNTGSNVYWYCPASHVSFLSQWTYLEQWSEMGTANVADGRFGGMLNGIRCEFADIPIYANTLMRDVEYGYGTNELAIAEYIGNCDTGPCQMEIRYDEVYADSTLSRVFIGNASLFENVTDINMQIPSSWSDNSIQVEFNAGAYADNDAAYLYVADYLGSINAIGYPVTIGASEGAPSAPGRPQNVTATEND